MYVFLFWIVLSFVFASIGGKRKIGYVPTLLICLIFSPLIGIICVALSKDKQTDRLEKQMLGVNVTEPVPTTEDFKTLEMARVSGIITEEEYKRRLDILRSRL